MGRTVDGDILGRFIDAEFAGEAGLGGFEFEELVVVGKCDV